jgi:hypothetical protein
MIHDRKVETPPENRLLERRNAARYVASDEPLKLHHEAYTWQSDFE